jgi:hypothetical protein
LLSSGSERVSGPNDGTTCFAEYNDGAPMTIKTHDAGPSGRFLINVALFLFLWFGMFCAAQSDQSPPPLHNPAAQTAPTEDSWEIQQRKEAVKKFNLQRQQEIKKDAEKLLELATELKQDVDKTNENTLSLDVIKKADQIEKLAKTVRDKMKGP